MKARACEHVGQEEGRAEAEQQGGNHASLEPREDRGRRGPASASASMTGEDGQQADGGFTPASQAPPDEDQEGPAQRLFRRSAFCDARPATAGEGVRP